MPPTKKEIRDFYHIEVSTDEALKFLHVSRATFYRLIEAGAIPKNEDGIFILGEVVKSYMDYQFGKRGLVGEKTRLTKAQADREELELAEKRGELLKADSVKKVWTDNIMKFKTKLLAMPSKLPPVLMHREAGYIQKTLKEEIYNALKELAGFDAEKIQQAAEN